MTCHNPTKICNIKGIQPSVDLIQYLFRHKKSLQQNLIIIIFVYPQLNQRDGLLTRSTVVQAQRAERKLICVPLMFVFCRIWGTVRFILMVVKGREYTTSNWLLILQVSGLKEVSLFLLKVLLGRRKFRVPNGNLTHNLTDYGYECSTTEPWETRLFTVPYFSVGFSRLVRFYRTPAILLCNAQ